MGLSYFYWNMDFSVTSNKVGKEPLINHGKQMQGLAKDYISYSFERGKFGLIWPTFDLHGLWIVPMTIPSFTTLYILFQNGLSNYTKAFWDYLWNKNPVSQNFHFSKNGKHTEGFRKMQYKFSQIFTEYDAVLNVSTDYVY